MARFPPPRIARCSALPRSFVLGTSGAAAATPGQRLRSGDYMATNRKRERASFQGNPLARAVTVVWLLLLR